MHGNVDISEVELIERLKRQGVPLSRRALDGYVAKKIVSVSTSGKKGSPRRFFENAVDTIASVKAETGGRKSIEKAEVSAWLKSSKQIPIPRSAFKALAQRAMQSEILSELSSFAQRPAELDDDERCDRALEIAEALGECIGAHVGVSSDLLAEVFGDALVNDEPLASKRYTADKLPGTDYDLVLDASLAISYRGLFNLERFVAFVTDEQLLRGRRVARAFEKALPFARKAREKALGEYGPRSIGPKLRKEIVAFSRLVLQMDGVASFEGVLQSAQFVQNDGDALRIETGCRALEEYVKAPRKIARR